MLDYHLQNTAMRYALVAAIKDRFARDQGQRAIRTLRLTRFHDSNHLKFSISRKTSMTPFSLEWIDEPEMEACCDFPTQYFVHKSTIQIALSQDGLMMFSYRMTTVKALKISTKNFEAIALPVQMDGIKYDKMMHCPCTPWIMESPMQNRALTSELLHI